MGISVSLYTAMSALMAQQAAVDTTSHNVANVNTPGFSRQRVHLAPVVGAGIYAGIPSPGGGVEILDINRVRDLFVDFQVRNGNHALGYHNARAGILEQAELAFGEPGEGGLRTAMSQFWNAWRDLANAPEMSATRSAVVQSGTTLAFTANRVHASLVALRDQADGRVLNAVDELNSISREIAALNMQIGRLKVNGDTAGDLLDRRDLLLDRLSEVTSFQLVERDNGMIDLSIGGKRIVGGPDAYEVYADRDITNHNYITIRFVADGAELKTTGGEIAGLLHQRDVDLPARIADLNAMVSQLIADVNAVHGAGFALDGVTTGLNFFAGTDASDIEVDPALLADLNLLAAATAPGAQGDGSGATAISDLQFVRNLAGGTQNYDEYYQGTVSRLGDSVRDAKRLVESQRLMVDHLDQLRQSVSGVNLDEEMVNLVQFQRGYEAAARLVRVVDEMLDTLINRTAV